MTITRLIIAQYERALVWKSKRFAGILTPGVRWIVTPFVNVAVELYDTTVPEFEHPRIDLLLKEARVEMERHFDIVELGEQEVGVVYKNGKLAGILPPGKRQLYWKGPVAVRVTRQAHRLRWPGRRAEGRGANPGAGELMPAASPCGYPHGLVL